MIKTMMTSLFGTRFDRERKRIQPIVDQIHAHEERLKDFSEDQLKDQTSRFRQQCTNRYRTAYSSGIFAPFRHCPRSILRKTRRHNTDSGQFVPGYYRM